MLTRAAFSDSMCQKVSVLQSLMRYAVAVMKENFGVGYTPRKTSAIACRYYRLELLWLL